MFYSEVGCCFAILLTARDFRSLTLTSHSGVEFTALMIQQPLLWSLSIQPDCRTFQGNEDYLLFLSSPAKRVRQLMFDKKGVKYRIREWMHTKQLSDLQKQHLKSARVQEAIYAGEVSLVAASQSLSRSRIKNIYIEREQRQALRDGCFLNEIAHRSRYNIDAFWKTHEVASFLYKSKSIHLLSSESVGVMVSRYPFSRYQVRHLNSSRVLELLKNRSDYTKKILFDCIHNMPELSIRQREAMANGCLIDEVKSIEMRKVDVLAAERGYFHLVGKRNCKSELRVLWRENKNFLGRQNPQSSLVDRGNGVRARAMTVRHLY